MFQLIHDYNALPIQGAVEFLDIQHPAQKENLFPN